MIPVTINISVSPYATRSPLLLHSSQQMGFFLTLTPPPPPPLTPTTRQQQHPANGTSCSRCKKAPCSVPPPRLFCLFFIYFYFIYFVCGYKFIRKSAADLIESVGHKMRLITY